MNIKKNILLIFFLSFFLFQPVWGEIYSEEDEIIIKQLVDNSCNENNLCEANLNETIYTCPHDCHQGNGDPSIWQKNAEAEGGVIEISNIIITVEENGVVTIAWQTNKPTNAVLILEDGLGKMVNTYSEGLFTVSHSFQIKELDLSQDYYFKIFAEGIFGDDNYETATLYLMKPTDILDNFSDNFEKIGNTEGQDSKEMAGPSEELAFYSVQEIKDEKESNKWSGVIPTSLGGFSEKKYSNMNNDIFSKSKKIIEDWWFQLMLFLGIIHFIYLIFEREQKIKSNI